MRGIMLILHPCFLCGKVRLCEHREVGLLGYYRAYHWQASAPVASRTSTPVQSAPVWRRSIGKVQ